MTSVTVGSMWTAEEVRGLRERLQMDVSNFAKILGVDVRTVTRWEAGQARPTGAAEAVLNGLREKLNSSANEDDVTKVIAVVAGAAALGGLAFLIYKLLDSVDKKGSESDGQG